MRTLFNPFDVSSDADYRQWRERKLVGFPATLDELIVPVQDPGVLDEAEYKAIISCCNRANMAIYRTTGEGVTDKNTIRNLGLRLGLQRLDTNLRADEDSITSLRAVPDMQDTHYIPYTDKSLNWHTDGYYNRLDEQVHGIIMHCVTPAASGGSNLLLDPEMVYIQLRDENPDYISALMQPDVMTIPSNVESGTEIRPAQTGPVFSVEKSTRSLHMRYTARTRSIVWKDAPGVQMAVGFLGKLLNSQPDYIFRYRLQAGEGVICNNVIHGRESFADDTNSTRLLYRARYHDRIKGTEMQVGKYRGTSCSG